METKLTQYAIPKHGMLADTHNQTAKCLSKLLCLYNAIHIFFKQHSHKSTSKTHKSNKTLTLTFEDQWPCTCELEGHLSLPRSLKCHWERYHHPVLSKFHNLHVNNNPYMNNPFQKTNEINKERKKVKWKLNRMFHLSKKLTHNT